MALVVTPGAGGSGDQDLAQKAQQGDLSAFEALATLHLRRVRRFVSLNAPARMDFDDVVQETFLFAYRNIGRFRRGSSFAGWLRSIAWNLVRAERLRYSRAQSNLFRYAAKRPSAVEASEDASGELDRLARSLEDLPPALRELLEMRYALRYSIAEIAARSQRSVAWVKSALFRLRGRLKNACEAAVQAENGTLGGRPAARS